MQSVGSSFLEFDFTICFLSTVLLAKMDVAGMEMGLNVSA